MFHDPKAFNAGQTGYRIVYRANETNHCPGCGRTHWFVGRMTAECAYCATAIPLESGLTLGAGLFRTRGKTDAFAPLAA
ncbi:hypothetical protein [Parasphingopyxis marina]|uniref:Uncharacterized protein n=1 Tax=Parasphingopyxis marina TaxID=2761622 RepID=A0A842I2Z7_9SPHN|nr:hypothetical protein [Parasphingopyxis marina]MBC2779183.1 hypothetical protein [Parasphingopyxis marina]